MSKTIKLLSDEELLAAQDSEYMSEAQLQTFKQRLLDEEKALRDAAESTAHHLQETEAAPDPTDRASAEEARALIGQPEILIADEPTSALDAERQAAFVELLLSEARLAGSTVVFVSHDLRLAAHFDHSLALAP